MASILDRYGIKEVADLTFYSIDANTGRPRTPVLYIDTAKVSTVESTAETSYAEGGKGNGRLLAWDFGKEITMTIEDAVFSPKSLSIMFGDGSAPSKNIKVTGTAGTIYRTIVVNASDLIAKMANSDDTISARINRLIKNATGIVTSFTTAECSGTSSKIAYTAPNSEISGTNYALALSVPTTAAAGSFSVVEGQGAWSIPSQDSKIFVSFYVTPENGFQVDVGPDTFPGTYYITADTYARAEADGSDQYLQIIIPKGKITSENTLTMEADGDPTVFNMNVEVLRATVDGKNVMMQIVQYGFDASAASDTGIVLDTRIDGNEDTTDYVSA